MQTPAVERNVTTSGALASAEFGISLENAAHIMGILRSTLYSRKALAVLREYGANAWDEHREAGIPSKPIQVQLPSHMRPTLKIRDFGRGLSEDQVLNLYTKYGLSTKRNSNTGTGMLGIGCKAGFAYADQFTITSWHTGTKSVYVAVLDRSNKGRMDKVYEEPCDETGVEIQIAIRPNDVDEFIREARGLFRYFRPQPNINMILPALPTGMERGFIRETKDDGWIAVMGCIPYRLDITQMKEGLTQAGIWECLSNLSGGVYVPIGEVEFSASREELQYTEVTIKAITEALKALMEDYVNDAMSSIKAEGVTGWDRRLKAGFLAHILKFPLPKDLKHLTETGVPLYSREQGIPTTFKLVNNSHEACYRVNVRQDAHILILDDKVRTVQGWRFNNSYDVLAIPQGDATYEQVKAEIETFAQAAGIDGVPIDCLTKRGYWSSPRSVNGKRRYPANQKHKDRCFTLNEGFHDSTPRSAQWTSAVPPEGEHLFVIISEFSPKGSSLSDMRRDMELLASWKVEWPTIYGYKTTDAKPVKPEDIENGMAYATWRAKILEGLMTDAVKDTLRDIAWGEMFINMPYEFSTDREKYDGHVCVDFNRGLRDLVAALTHDLGEKHPVTRYFAKVIEARRELSSLARGRREAVQNLAKAAKYNSKRSGPGEWFKRIVGAYPMIGVFAKTDSDLGVFHPKHHYNAIVSYIIDQDRLAGGSKPIPEA